MISNRYELVVQDDVRVVVVVVVAFVVETGSQEDLSARVGAWASSFPGPANTRPGGGFVSVVIVICDPLGLRLGSARPPKKTENVVEQQTFFFLSLSLSFQGEKSGGLRSQWPPWGMLTLRAPSRRGAGDRSGRIFDFSKWEPSLDRIAPGGRENDRLDRIARGAVTCDGGGIE